VVESWLEAVKDARQVGGGCREEDGRRLVGAAAHR
jgi:hypothetical protein